MSRLFLPAGTNYATNPGYEAGTAYGVLPTGWSDDKNVTGPTPYDVAAALGDNGSRSFRIQYTGVAGDAGKYIAPTCWTDVGSFAPGDVLYFTCLMKSAWTGLTLNRLHVTYCDSDYNVLAAIDTTIPASSGGVVTLGGGVYAAAPASTSLVGFCPQFGGIDNGDTIDVTFDDLLVTKSMSPYFDGSFDDCDWAGAANASVSTRDVCALSYLAPQLLAAEGTIAFRWEPLFASTDDTVETHLIHTDGTGPVRVGRNDIGWIFAYFGDVPDGIDIASPTAWSAGDSLVTVLRWEDAATIDLEHQGVDAGQVATAGRAVNFTHVNLPMRAASNYAGYIGPVLVSPERKSDAWVDAISESGGARFSDTLGLFNRFMSPGDHLYPLDDSAKGYAKEPVPVFDPDLNVVVDGNSMSSPADGCYGDQLALALTSACTVTVMGRGGYRTPQMEADAATRIDTLLKARHTNVLCAWEIANDIDAGTAVATAEASFQTYCEHRQAAGWTVVVLTLLPRSHATTRADFLANRATCNTWLRANWASFADGLADVAADSRIGDNGDSDDATYYADKIHMTVTGYGVVAGIVRAAVESLP